MAWTTSACLRARPIGQILTAARSSSVWLLLVRLYRSLRRRPMPRWHPNFALAVPFLALGFLSPLLPTSLTTGLLLTAGTALVLLTVGIPRLRQVPVTIGHQSSGAFRTAPSAFQASEIALQQVVQHMAAVPPAARRPHTARGPRDRSWAELMARINHDLRTPLNAVIGFSEVMVLELFGPLGDERYQDYAQHIRDSAADLLKSAEDTLAMTALTANPNPPEDPTDCNIEHLANDAWAFVCRKAAARGVDFVSCVPSGLEVQGEARTLRQIFVNMLSEGVARADYGASVMLTTMIDGELIELTVSVSKERAAPVCKDGSLAICLARTLLEMQGSTLLEFESASQGWRAVTVLDRAAQPDFFKDRFSAKPRESMVLAS